MPTSDRRVKKGFPQEEFEPRVKGCLVRDEGREVERERERGKLVSRMRFFGCTMRID